MHPPCTCSAPTRECPRYGVMTGHKWVECRRPPSDKRDKLLDFFHPTWKSVINAAASFVGAVAQHIADDFAKVSPQTLAKRRAICETCEYNACGQCMLCKCVISLKTEMPSQFCPDGRWQAESATVGCKGCS